MKSIVLSIFIFVSNAFSAVLNASMIDPLNVSIALGLLASMVLSIILVRIGYRKVFQILGR